MKRTAEVLVLSSDDEDDAPVASTSRSAPASRSSHRSNGATISGGAGGAGEDDQFEADIARAMALSLEASATTSSGPTASTSSSSGASRADMERERLARQRKREENGTATTVKPRTTGDSGSSKRAKVATLANLAQDNVGLSPLPHNGASYSSPGALANLFSNIPHSSSSSSQSSKLDERFWSGAIKRVACKYHPDPTSFAFGELIGPSSTLQLAIVGAFCLDPAWVVPHFPEDTPLLLLTPGKPNDPTFSVCDLKSKTFRAIPDNKINGQHGNMHTKVMVYYHPTFVRIVIPTANAVPYDWSTIDNAFYVHDFPLQSRPLSPSEDPSPLNNPTHTEFSRRFFAILQNLNVPKRFLVNSRAYDFSSSSDIRLVWSTQGRYEFRDEREVRKSGGLGSLARGVESFNFAPGGRWEIEVTGSSIGKYTTKWLCQFYAACLGIEPISYFTRRGKELPPANVVPTQPERGPIKLPLKIVFPTEDELVNSYMGPEHGGTLFCPTSSWNTSTFPRHLFHRGQSKRDRVPAHTKIILALHKYSSNAPSSSPQKHEGWIYVGSHNFTGAAWGRPENGSGGPQITLNNYELGVLLPLRANSAEELERLATETVTYKRSLVRYSASEQPWQQEKYLGT
ncbi:hypothetical protein JCM10207_004710 [Rhodosporidiobolus poonsookiae]